MKRTILFVGLLLLLVYSPNLVEAQGNNIQTRFFVSYDNETITIAGAAIGFTTTKITPSGFSYRASLVTFRVECVTSPCPIRVLSNGNTPNASSGILLNEGDIVSVFGFDDISRFKGIRTGANSASIVAVYSR